MTVGVPPPSGTTTVPALVAVSRIVPAGSVVHGSEAPAARSACLHPAVSNELMVARVAPASQCAATAYAPAKPSCAWQPLVESPVSPVRSTCGLAPSAPAATRVPCCPVGSTASRYRTWLPSIVAATHGASDDDDTA